MLESRRQNRTMKCMNRFFWVLVVLLALVCVGCRSAKKEARAAEANAKAPKPSYPPLGSIERRDKAIDELIAPDAKIEKLAEGFDWSEGPVWMKQGGGYLLF